MALYILLLTESRELVYLRGLVTCVGIQVPIRPRSACRRFVNCAVQLHHTARANVSRVRPKQAPMFTRRMSERRKYHSEAWYSQPHAGLGRCSKVCCRTRRRERFSARRLTLCSTCARSLSGANRREDIAETECSRYRRITSSRCNLRTASRSGLRANITTTGMTIQAPIHDPTSAPDD